MSYGKQDDHLTRIAGYGATSSQAMGNASRRQSGPRKGSPSWANNYEPTEGVLDLIRLIPGKFISERVDQVTGQVSTEETGWFEFTEHYHGGLRKGMICSAGIHRRNDSKLAKPCRGCDISNEDFRERIRIEKNTGVKPQAPNRMSFSSKYAFIVLELGEPTLGGWFFKGYRYDRDGRVAVGKQNQPFMDWLKYTGPNDPAFQHISRDLASQNKQVEFKVGHVQTWPVGFGQFKALEAYSDIVQRHCKSCGGQNCIHITNYVCAACGCPTLQESTLPPDKIKELVSQEVTCRNCQRRSYPYAVQACQYCQNGKSASIWDIDLQVTKTKVNKTSQLMIPWSSPPKGIDPMYAETLKKLPEVEKKFAITPYEEQVQLFGRPEAEPQGQQPQQPQYQQPNYGDPGQYAQSYSNQPQGFAAPPAPHGYQQPAPAQPGWGQPQPLQQPQQPQWGGPPSGGYNNQ